MDGLAVEVIEKIAAFACTDGGRTGLSLSLTSKYIREATRAVRFHSVSLTKGPKQVSQFSSHFNAERVALSDRTVPRIRHLCIAPGGEVIEICKSAASDLYTLALVRRHGFGALDISGTHFPLLQELTILGSGSEFGELSAHPKFPSLTRLYILPLRTLMKLVSAPDLRLWSERAPEVTHLRVAFPDDDNVVLKAQIENIAAPELLGLPVMFPKLEQALIQPMCILDIQGGRPIKPTFGSSTLATRPLALLPPPTMTTLEHLGSLVEREWWDGIGGGPGCWVGRGDHVIS